MHNRKLAQDALNTLQPIAEKHQATLAQLILYCTYHMPGITAILVGARNAAQASENAKTLSLRLTEDERFAIVSAFAAEEMQLAD
jgi:aryl-alcohol dehydrogenase-like predicted oxidoreductase